MVAVGVNVAVDENDVLAVKLAVFDAVMEEVTEAPSVVLSVMVAVSDDVGLLDDVDEADDV